MTTAEMQGIHVDDYEPQDDFFGTAYIDVDEWRDTPEPHRYLHGGFEGTDARFSMYLPPVDIYQGRLVMTFGGASGGDERSAQQNLILNAYHNAFSNGAYLIESNQGHLGASMDGLRGDMTIMQGRTDNETARLSFHVAEQVYGSRPRHSYCYGGSGGGNFTLWAMEREDTVFDGGVPFMFGGSPFPETMNAVRLLRTKIRGVVDAMQAGGSGDPFAGLDTAQRDALATLYRAGFQRGGEFQLVLPMPEISWPTCASMMHMQVEDPTYFTDFWTEPGYLGADSGMDSQVFEVATKIASVLTASEIALASDDGFAPRMLRMLGAEGTLGLRLEGADVAGFTCTTMTVRTGKAAGRRMYNFLVLGDVLVPAGLGAFFDPRLLDDIEPGDEVTIDNRDFLAYCYLSRYRARPVLTGAPYRVLGEPVYPQRVDNSGRLAWKGNFGGKVILMQHLRDRPCWPAVAIEYQRKAADSFGAKLDDHFRLWWTERAMHGPAVAELGNTTRAIDYTGLISQGIRDVIAWVEDGVEPAPTCGYDYVDGQVVLRTNLAERAGIQPRVGATVNGGSRAEVGVGETVELLVEAETPPQGGFITAAEWDFDGTGSWAFAVEGIHGRSTSINARVEHSYAAPGTYFATVRVHAHRAGDTNAATERLDNIANVRIVVT